MRRSWWMSKAKALAATTVMACGALLASTSAQADLYNYSYSSTASSTQLSGTFQATLSGFGSGTSGSFNGFTGMGTTLLGPSSVTGGFGELTNGQGFVGLFTSNTGTVTASGPVSGNSDAFSFGSALSGLFSATDSSSGGGGGGGGSSGGAPSPEVNAFLGLALAGGTFVFLRRKRGGRHGAMAA